jgi:hypothetical protein
MPTKKFRFNQMKDMLAKERREKKEREGEAKAVSVREVEALKLNEVRLGTGDEKGARRRS